MHKLHKHRGFMLLIAVACIPLVGLLILVTSAHTAQLSHKTQQAWRQCRQKNLLFSAEAWLRAHPETVRAMEPEQTIPLPIADAAGPCASATATVVSKDDGGVQLLLTLTPDSPATPIVLKKTMPLSF